MIPEGTAAELLDLMETEQGRLREVLRGAEPEALGYSAGGKWSVIENLRHLLFVEQGLRQFCDGKIALSPLGYPPPGLWKHRMFASFTFDARPSAGEVLAERDAAHAAIRSTLSRDDAEVRLALGKNVRHLRGHIKQVESALRAWKKEDSRQRPAARSTTR